MTVTLLVFPFVQNHFRIDSENYLWSKLKKDYSMQFPDLIDRSNFNKRRRRLQLFIHEVTKNLSVKLNEGEDVFIIDSIPVPVCKIAREKRCKFGRDAFESAPDKGYSAVTKSYYYGYKLHLVTSVKGVFYSMEVTQASVHDVHYLKEVADTKMKNATLIGDKGYIAKQIQIDLFHHCNVRLQTPCRNNQQEQTPWHPVFRKSRKRIETLFSQLCDQIVNTGKTDPSPPRQTDPLRTPLNKRTISGLKICKELVAFVFQT